MKWHFFPEAFSNSHAQIQDEVYVSKLSLYFILSVLYNIVPACYTLSFPPPLYSSLSHCNTYCVSHAVLVAEHAGKVHAFVDVTGWGKESC